MNVTEAITARKSVRAYLDTPVPADVLEKIVEAGRWAPNAGPIQLSVVRNAELRKKINDVTLDAMAHSGIEFLRQRAALPGYQPLYDAPVLILISGPVTIPISAVNAAVSAENMLLQATGAGLGSCFLLSLTLAFDGADGSDLLQKAGIPDGYRVQCAVIVGYAAPESKFTTGERTIKGAVSYID
ncbi:nitroreductase [Geobacter metallireducens RCH3]|uniref:Oxidoreductase related to nitroreductase, putative n=1 Tax=Geobacter metallireducens (strain ATCC 53774 / DSM 7210 / GS-15) TaxID=269799 RepID=Q39Q19_GEOMG|nr:nitroreductase family protein [Geobacter metallireducens]ABB33655.1 oxidoreductase related to nitroreductase, putative [Geobacter metallireducens GS-15]EHP84083.1 nitroreductase [Geobacter metallireducens RCH3]